MTYCYDCQKKLNKKTKDPNIFVSTGWGDCFYCLDCGELARKRFFAKNEKTKGSQDTK